MFPGGGNGGGQELGQGFFRQYDEHGYDQFGQHIHGSGAHQHDQGQDVGPPVQQQPQPEPSDNLPGGTETNKYIRQIQSHVRHGTSVDKLDSDQQYLYHHAHNYQNDPAYRQHQDSMKSSLRRHDRSGRKWEDERGFVRDIYGDLNDEADSKMTRGEGQRGRLFPSEPQYAKSRSKYEEKLRREDEQSMQQSAGVSSKHSQSHAPSTGFSAATSNLGGLVGGTRIGAGERERINENEVRRKITELKEVRGKFRELTKEGLHETGSNQVTNAMHTLYGNPEGAFSQKSHGGASSKKSHQTGRSSGSGLTKQNLQEHDKKSGGSKFRRRDLAEDQPRANSPKLVRRMFRWPQSEESWQHFRMPESAQSWEKFNHDIHETPQEPQGPTSSDLRHQHEHLRQYQLDQEYRDRVNHENAHAGSEAREQREQHQKMDVNNEVWGMPQQEVVNKGQPRDHGYQNPNTYSQSMKDYTHRRLNPDQFSQVSHSHAGSTRSRGQSQYRDVSQVGTSRYHASTYRSHGKTRSSGTAKPPQQRPGAGERERNNNEHVQNLIRQSLTQASRQHGGSQASDSASTKTVSTQRSGLSKQNLQRHNLGGK